MNLIERGKISGFNRDLNPGESELYSTQLDTLSGKLLGPDGSGV